TDEFVTESQDPLGSGRRLLDDLRPTQIGEVEPGMERGIAQDAGDCVARTGELVLDAELHGRQFAAVGPPLPPWGPTRPAATHNASHSTRAPTVKKTTRGRGRSHATRTTAAATPPARCATVRRRRIELTIAPAPAAIVATGSQVASSSSSRVACWARMRSVDRNKTKRFSSAAG